MAKKLRVLVVDDSAFMRRVISQMVEANSDFEVVGTARDGREGVDMTMALKPDVITMDIEMPRMNGLEAVELIMSKRPTPIIMLSSLTTEGAEATFDALDKGAMDYMDKNLDRSALDIVKIQEQLQEKIRAVSKKRARVLRPRPIIKQRVGLPLVGKGSGKPGFATQKIAFVAIGASTGGPRAVQEVLSKLPGGLSTPFVISVHMPGAFTGTFAERLNTISELSVKEAENGEKVEDGKALVCPGGKQTRVMRKGITDFYMRINQEPSDAIYKPSVDITMSSVAEAYPGRSLGVILTGMGADGAKGMKAIKDRGGKTLVQNEESCVVYGMPKAVVDAGTADKVISLELIAGEIVNMI